MNLIADILLVAGALGAGLYCHVLAGRLRRFTDLERGVGGAVAVLSAQIDDLTRAVALARAEAQARGMSLADQTERAETAGKRLELLVAALHDLPAPAAPADAPQREPLTARHPFFVRRPAEGAGQ
ncbi:hypothetical protein [Histidinibacterium lentulum]|uniref:Uncharacterized protein n=1 Tax=Histidinibacterium lentulum TaxID=2480588 RepID=A0A3N2R734_9RHOB|nr:hypothetical protein [Histidinibacterium lentulum]ROU03237.1 hypothetical protein EAT49_08085 [Histidinibacterium lentulum]